MFIDIEYFYENEGIANQTTKVKYVKIANRDIV